ncbi:hypothetical protein ACQY0O_006984 [Thecaphora frezii]
MYHTQAAAASTTTPEPNGQAQKAASATNTAASPTTSPSISGSAVASPPAAASSVAQQLPKKGSKNSKSKKRSKSKSKSSGQKSASSSASNTSSNASSEEKEPGALPNNDPSLDTKEGENRKDEPSTSSDGSGSKPKRPRSSSANKELAQLGLGSFGNATEDDSDMKRSRQVPNGSPDPQHKNEDSHPNEHAADQRAPKPEEVDVGVSGLQNGALMRETSMEDAAYAQEAAEAELDPERGDEGVTRCICGSTDENVGLMIQCEMCMCWQHCICMGMQYEEDCLDVYFCEECKPELHIPLLRSLGLLPQSRNNKKGSKHSSKCSARELNQAKESTAALAQANARRNQNEASTSYATPSSSRERRQGSHSKPESESKQQTPKSTKRRSTMNSRNSVYGGWEPIPLGLLNEGEAWETNDAPSAAQEDRRPARKRKRSSTDDVDDQDSALTPDPTDETSASAAEVAKRHRMSAGGSVQPGEADDEAGALGHHGSKKEETSTVPSKSSKNKKNSGHSSARAASAPKTKPRHPNQYTYHNKDRNTVSVGSGAAGKGGSTSASTLMSHSPSPSPSKSRAESVRRSARDGRASRTGTPAPGNSNGGGNSGSSRLHNPGAPWGLPDHLAHLAYLLPISVSKPQNTHANGSKLAMPSSSNERQAAANTSTMATPRHVSARSSLPHPYSVVSAIEATTKVRFPSQRMTLAEMQRRVRSIGEFVTRSQIEAVDREKRMRLLGIVPDYLKEDEGQGADNDDDDETDAGGALGKPESEGDATSPAMASTAQQPPLSPSSSKVPDTAMAEGEGGAAATAKAKSIFDNMPLSMRLMEELTSELIHFQRRFGTGLGAYGSFSGDGSSGSTSVAA